MTKEELFARMDFEAKDSYAYVLLDSFLSQKRGGERAEAKGVLDLFMLFYALRKSRALEVEANAPRCISLIDVASRKDVWRFLVKFPFKELESRRILKIEGSNGRVFFALSDELKPYAADSAFSEAKKMLGARLKAYYSLLAHSAAPEAEATKVKSDNRIAGAFLEIFTALDESEQEHRRVLVNALEIDDQTESKLALLSAQEKIRQIKSWRSLLTPISEQIAASDIFGAFRSPVRLSPPAAKEALLAFEAGGLEDQKVRSEVIYPEMGIQQETEETFGEKDIEAELDIIEHKALEPEFDSPKYPLEVDSPLFEQNPVLRVKRKPPKEVLEPVQGKSEAKVIDLAEKSRQAQYLYVEPPLKLHKAPKSMQNDPIIENTLPDEDAVVSGSERLGVYPAPANGTARGTSEAMLKRFRDMAQSGFSFLDDQMLMLFDDRFSARFGMPKPIFRLFDMSESLLLQSDGYYYPEVFTFGSRQILIAGEWSEPQAKAFIKWLTESRPASASQRAVGGHELSHLADQREAYPVSMSIFGFSYAVKTWGDVLMKLCEVLQARKPFIVASFDRQSRLNDGGVFFSYDKSHILAAPRMLLNGLWIETGRDEIDMMRACAEVVSACGYEPDVFIVETT